MDYIRKIMYLQEQKGAESRLVKGGFSKLIKQKGTWKLYLHIGSVIFADDAPVYLAGEREGILYAYKCATANAADIVLCLDKEAGEFMRNISFRGIFIGYAGHYLAGEITVIQAEKQEFRFSKARTWRSDFQQKSESEAQATERVAISAEIQAEEGAGTSAEVRVEEGEDTLTELHAAESTEPVRFEPMYPFEDDEFAWCYQISPADLKSFATPVWHLSQNSFLLQGFYNYRHLLYANANNKNYIGVPGQYHRRDQFLAAQFGFSGFKGTRRKKITVGDFGYWMYELGKDDTN